MVTLVFVGIAWVGPRVLGLYYQIQGGKQLREVLQKATIAEEIACTTEPLTDTVYTQPIQLAIGNLNQAIRHSPTLAQAYLLLGRAYCALGEYDGAVRVYDEYARLRPENPEGHLELGLGYVKIDVRSNLARNASVEWQGAGILLDDFLTNAKMLFAARQAKDARYWYEFAAALKPVTSADAFEWGVVSIASTGTLPQVIKLPVYSLGKDGVIIQGENLQVLGGDSGERLASVNIDGVESGVMWGNGCSVGIVDVPQARYYRITIQAQNSLPAPIQLRMAIDFGQKYDFELTRADLSWQGVTTQVYLSAQLHVIEICFLNDGIINNNDRNLFLDWIEVSPQE